MAIPKVHFVKMVEKQDGLPILLGKFYVCLCVWIDLIQLTLVISKSKGPSETLQDIRTSTYQMCRIEENTKQPKDQSL